MADYIAYIGETTNISFVRDSVSVRFVDSSLTTCAEVMLDRLVVGDVYYCDIKTSSLDCDGYFHSSHVNIAEARNLIYQCSNPPNSYCTNSTTMAFVSGTHSDDVKFWNLSLDFGDMPEPDPEPDLNDDFKIVINANSRLYGGTPVFEVSWDFLNTPSNISPMNLCVYVYGVGESLLDTYTYSIGSDEYQRRQMVYSDGVQDGSVCKFKIEYYYYLDSASDELRVIYDETDYIKHSLLSPVTLMIKTASGWVKGKPFIKTEMGWKEAKKIFIKTSDGWKESVN